MTDTSMALRAQPPGAPNDALISFIERAARDTSFDVTKFSALLAERAAIEREMHRRAFHSAMSDVQSEIGQIDRDRKNPAFQSRYATLEALDAVARPVYTRHGFALTYGSLPPSAPGLIRISCTVSHRDGHSETYELEGPVSTAGAKGGRVAMNDIQAVGSAVTYLRRYLLMMLFNLVQTDDAHDDDGTGPRPAPPPQAKKTTTMQDHAKAAQAKTDLPADAEQRIDAFLTNFKARCMAAQTSDDADAIIKDQAVMTGSDWLNRNNKAKWDEFCQLRDAMLLRFFGGSGNTNTDPLVP